MRSWGRKLALLFLAGMAVIGLAALPSTTGMGSSEAQQGSMQNCPQAGKWAISVWDGQDWTDAWQALANCGEGTVDAAYYIDPHTQVWSRWFGARPEISDLTRLNNGQGVLALGSAAAAASPVEERGVTASSAQQGSMNNCPRPGRWAISVWDGAPGTPVGEALATCAGAEVEAAYSIDPETQGWHGYLLDNPDISNLTALDHMQGVLTFGSAASLVLQEGNHLPKTQLQPKRSNELADNRLGTFMHGFWQNLSLTNFTDVVDRQIAGLGLKRMRLAINELDWDLVDWTKPEFSIDPRQDDFITRIANNGITITYVLSFWDKANHPEGWSGVSSRFKTEEEIERYLEFVQFIVHHFKDRVRYFEIWNEPDNDAFPVQYIEVADYINLVKRAVPVIRAEYPQARIVVGSTAYLRYPQSHGYLFSILQSDIMPLVDVVAWHPMYGTSPAYDDDREYYYEYPSIVQQIKDTASAHGFKGEYEGDEVGWRSPDCFFCNPGPRDSNIVAAKYYARGVLMHLGMDLTVAVGAVSDLRPTSFFTIRNLATVMAGAKAASLPVKVQSEATNIKSYTFSLPNGDRLIALWTDGVGVDDDPGVRATLTLTGISAQKVTGIDALNGFEQQLITNVEGGNLVVRNLLVKDYPIILRLAHAPPS
jgi:hypothetical protein